MAFPPNLEDWTYDTVVTTVRHHEYEPGMLDYKTVLNASERKDHNAHNGRIRETVCSMANSSGGLVLFGVQDRKERLHVSNPEERILGIPIPLDPLKDLQDKLMPIQPDLHFEARPTLLRLPADESRGILVVHVPQSALRPHMDETTGKFYRRGPGGSAEPMKFQQVRDQMLYSAQRMRKVTLLRLQIEEYRQLTALFIGLGDDVRSSVALYDVSGFRELLADIGDLIPMEGGLLQKLRRIPVYAQLLNAGIQQQGRVYLHAMLTGTRATHETPAWNISHDLQAFDDHCIACIHGLDDVFGMLGSERS